MAGHFRKLKNNKYNFEYMYKGKKYYKTVEASSDAAAKKLLDKFTVEIRENLNPTSSVLFINYAQKFIDEYARVKLSEKTVQTYLGFLNTRLVEYFGNKPLKDISTYDVQMFLNKISKELSTCSIKKYKAMLSVMFNTAMKWNLLNYNVCDKVDVPKGLNTEIKHVFLTREEVDKLLSCLAKETIDHQLIVQLALRGGLRRSEILGLSWKNIDFKNKTITIEKTLSYVVGKGTKIAKTKNEFSKRTIHISNEILDLFAKKDNVNIEPGHLDELIFGMHNVDFVTKWFSRFLKRHNLKHMRFHDLRHTHATLLISSGVQMKTVSSRLGHSTISTTMNIYTHTLSEDDKKASEII